MMYYSDFLPFHMFGFGFIFMVLFWGLVIYGAVVLLRSNTIRSSSEQNRALDTLKERYAKGEITKEQFDTIKKDIQ